MSFPSLASSNTMDSVNTSKIIFEVHTQNWQLVIETSHSTLEFGDYQIMGQMVL